MSKPTNPLSERQAFRAVQRAALYPAGTLGRCAECGTVTIYRTCPCGAQTEALSAEKCEAYVQHGHAAFAESAKPTVRGCAIVIQRTDTRDDAC